MGSPLAPLLANVIMSFYESKWLNEYNLNKPKFYLRNIDDLRNFNEILSTFKKEQDSLNFLNVLNNKHPKVKFLIDK